LKLFINLCFQNLLKTATDCSVMERQLQRDACGRLCAHSTCSLTMPARELL